MNRIIPQTLVNMITHEQNNTTNISEYDHTMNRIIPQTLVNMITP